MVSSWAVPSQFPGRQKSNYGYELDMLGESLRKIPGGNPRLRNCMNLRERRNRRTIVPRYFQVFF
jgi:hypothetical protein